MSSYCGLPEQLLTDNSSSFTSVKFGQFMQGCTTSKLSYHLASNCLAESVVQSFKVAMKKQMEGILETLSSRFLLHYSTTLMPQLTSLKQS